jgi:hypothetical protein
MVPVLVETQYIVGPSPTRMQISGPTVGNSNICNPRFMSTCLLAA